MEKFSLSEFFRGGREIFLVGGIFRGGDFPGGEYSGVISQGVKSIGSFFGGTYSQSIHIYMIGCSREILCYHKGSGETLPVLIYFCNTMQVQSYI